MLTRTLLCLTILLSGSAAVAQTAALSDQGLGGPMVPGVCLLSRDAIFANAAVGKVATARLQELSRAAQADIDNQRKPMESEAKALESLPDTPQTKSKRDVLATRWQSLQRQAAHTGQEIEATRTKVLSRLAAEAQPVIAQTYATRKCGLLLDRNIVVGGNLANDLTADIVKGLDAKIQTISIERERLPQQSSIPASGVR